MVFLAVTWGRKGLPDQYISLSQQGLSHCINSFLYDFYKYFSKASKTIFLWEFQIILCGFYIFWVLKKHANIKNTCLSHFASSIRTKGREGEPFSPTVAVFSRVSTILVLTLKSIGCCTVCWLFQQLPKYICEFNVLIRITYKQPPGSIQRSGELSGVLNQVDWGD